ncbi:MAG: glycolate oxidase subunit GlcE [Paracoccaceae bacterium]
MRVSTENELAEAIRDARGPLRVRGGGTRDVGRPVAGEVLDVSMLSGIALYEPEALTLVARAGTPLAEVEAILAGERQRLAFEPGDWRGLLGTRGEATVGGMVAANVSGPRRVQAGACRDALLGVRFVDGTGAIVKNGGRVMKNVTGYDLVKLMAGSWGTLGVLTEVSMKVLPMPETEATLVLEGMTDAQALVAMTRALGSPYDVTGAAHAGGRTLIRIEGFAQSVAYRTGRLERLLAPFAEMQIEVDAEKSRRLWRTVRDVEVFRERAGDVWRVSVKPSDAPEIAVRLGGEAVMDWGGGLIWALVPEGTDARARACSFGGHATLFRGAEATRRILPAFQPEAGPVASISAAIRRKFDPRGILNRGLMAPVDQEVSA